MDTTSHERSVYAWNLLKNFPPTVRESILTNSDFCIKYNLETDVQLSFGDSGISIQRSKFFTCVKEILVGSNSQPKFENADGETWILELIKQDNKYFIALNNGIRKLFLGDYSPLSSDQSIRLTNFDREAEETNLPEQESSYWRKTLSSGALPNEKIDELREDIEQTPTRVKTLILSGITAGESAFDTLVPRSEKYFNRLIGNHNDEINISEYAGRGAKNHISQLLSWRPFDGFLLSLLLSSHSLNLSKIEIDKINKEKLVHAYDWLKNHGDRISQLGAIELGLSILDKQPDLEPFIKDMIEQIRDDNVEAKQSRFQLLSSLIIFVEGELSYNQTLTQKPPYWRRLASIAQAALIEREFIGQSVDIAYFSTWAAQTRGQLFYLQTMADLRHEPRWQPDLATPQQLKFEFIGRIINAAEQNKLKINTPGLHELLFGETTESIQSLFEFPYPLLPGPLEGGIESQTEPPADIVEAIKQRLSEDVIQPNSFAALVNSALIFRLNSYHAQLAAKALRSVKHQLRLPDNTQQIPSVLFGLATVAAVTRSSELADELKILSRRCRHELGHSLSPEQTLRIGLITAAAHPKLSDWCEFVGGWVTELAFQSLEPNEVLSLHSHVKQLCHIVPDLWLTCGRAEAALASVADK